MGAPKGISTEDLILAYKELGTVKLVGMHFGMHASSVHERLQRVGHKCPKRFRPFEEHERDRIRVEYNTAAEKGELRALAKSMNREYGTLASEASRLGVANKNNRKLFSGVWKYMTEEQARDWLEKFKRFGRTMREFCLRNNIHHEGFSKTLRKYFPDEWANTVEANSYSQTMYRIGRALEYRVIAETKALGYFSLRAPASKGKIDVVSIRRGIVLFFQCKKGGYVGPAEWNGLWELSQSVGAKAVIASCPLYRGTVYREVTGPKLKWVKGLRKNREPSIPFVLK